MVRHQLFIASKQAKPKHQGFTLMELMVVILIVGILAAASIPIMRGKVDEAKWTEAKATAGVIRRAEKAYFAQTGQTIKGRLDKKKVLKALGLELDDFSGIYFTAADYRITKVDDMGNARIRIDSSKSNAPEGTQILLEGGTWK